MRPWCLGCRACCLGHFRTNPSYRCNSPRKGHLLSCTLKTRRFFSEHLPSWCACLIGVHYGIHDRSHRLGSHTALILSELPITCAGCTPSVFEQAIIFSDKNGPSEEIPFQQPFWVFEVLTLVGIRWLTAFWTKLLIVHCVKLLTTL